MSSEKDGYILGLFNGLLGSLTGKKSVRPEAGAHEMSLSDPGMLLDSALAELQKRKEKLREERTRALSDSPISFTNEDAGLSVGTIHKRIREEILSLHGSLGTKIDGKMLEEAREILLELDALVSGLRGSGFETRMRIAVVKHVIAECAKPAWSALCSLMERANETWPEPSGLPPWSEPQDVERARKRLVSEIADAFFGATPARIADRMLGIVVVWKANYPAPESAQWRELALQGVGYGIFARIIADAALKLRNESGALKAEAIRIISAEAVSVQNALDAGLSSAEDIDKVLEEVSALCEEIIPGLAWNSVSPTIEESIRKIAG